MKKQKSGWALLGLIVLAATCGQSAPLAEELTLVEADYRVKIHSEKVDTGGKPFWGATEANRGSVIRDLELSHKGKRVVVPLSSYSDLANARELTASKGKNGLMTLKIVGGDAADGYSCYIRIKDDEVVSRRVENGEFPKNFFEETTYGNEPIEE